MIALATLGQIDQRVMKDGKSFCLTLEFLGARKCELLNLRASAASVSPQAEQGTDLLNRKAEIAGIGNEPQAMEVALAIIAIAGTPARRRRDETDLLIMADHTLRDAALPRCLADVHSAFRLRRSALVTTLTEESAMAAAAMIGESRMPNSG